MKGPPGSQSLEYGFELKEEEMYKRLFLNASSTSAKDRAGDDDKPKKSKDENQPYASFDCPECVQMANLMLEEELRFYLQRNNNKRSKNGKSREALVRNNGAHN